MKPSKLVWAHDVIVKDLSITELEACQLPHYYVRSIYLKTPYSDREGHEFINVTYDIDFGNMGAFLGSPTIRYCDGELEQEVSLDRKILIEKAFREAMGGCAYTYPTTLYPMNQRLFVLMDKFPNYGQLAQAAEMMRMNPEKETQISLDITNIPVIVLIESGFPEERILIWGNDRLPWGSYPQQQFVIDGILYGACDFCKRARKYLEGYIPAKEVYLPIKS